jgi:hypothetical protein
VVARAELEPRVGDRPQDEPPFVGGAEPPQIEALRDHYAWQLRLYALAAERLLGVDVAGARLLLLDPGFGEDAVEVDVDVSGPRLEEARALCEAFAIASKDDRWPEDWRSLLPRRRARP